MIPLFLVTLTTVGYGDFYPSTTAGKIFTMLYIFVGIGLILSFLTTIAERSRVGRRGMLGRRRRSEEAETYNHHDAKRQREERD